MIVVELKEIKRKYEKHRLRDKNRESFLLKTIQEKGIQEALKCVKKGDHYILLDGYKRLRCALKLNIGTVPITVMGDNEAESILHLIRLSNDKTLNILEQAVFVDELKRSFALSVTEIANRLERSKAWVSVRLGILGEMSVYIREEVFAGRFPLRVFMYTLRKFTRVNKIKSASVDRFVKSVTGKGLSQRDIEKLAYGYFRGGDRLKEQIEAGKLEVPLKRLKEQTGSVYTELPELTEAERRFIHDLELAQKYVSRIRAGLSCNEKGTKTFHKTILVLLEGILDILEKVTKEVKDYYDWRKSA